MLRLLCAVAVIGAASDSILDNAVAWMKQNGAEVLDTTQHCIAAAKSAAVLHSKCGAAFNPEGKEGWAAFAAWGALEALQHMHNPLALQLQNSSFIKSSKEQAIKAYQQKNHDTIAQFCGQPDCVNNIGTMQHQYGTCYGGTEHSNCAKEGDYFCAEQTVHILMTNAKCFAEFKMPASSSESCTSECVDLWKKEEAEHPACMKIMDGQIKESTILTQKLSKQLILANRDPEARKAADFLDTNVTTWADVCINGQKLVMV